MGNGQRGKKILNNTYEGLLEEAIGKMRRSKHLHGCWHYLDDSTPGKRDYEAESERTRRLIETLKRFMGQIDADNDRMEASLSLF
jgi:hypothetical protein